MARLTDKQKRGLPPPPAATRRGANPWKLSDTARKAEPRPERSGFDLLDSLVSEASEKEAAKPGSESWRPDDDVAPPSREQRSRFGLWFLVVVGVGILIFLRGMFEGRDSGNWVRAIAPLVVIAFVVHGWWKARQRRRELKKSKAD